MNLFDGPDLLETTSTEVKNRILKPGQMLRAIDTGALYYGDKDGKPTAFVGASTSSSGGVVNDLVARPVFDDGRAVLRGWLAEAAQKGQVVTWVGDSITEQGQPAMGTGAGAGIGFTTYIERQYPGSTYYNKGIGGKTTVDLLSAVPTWMPDVLSTNADLYVVALGINDSRYNDSRGATSKTAYLANISSIITQLQASKGARVALLSIWPSWWTDQYAALGRKRTDDRMRDWSAGLSGLQSATVCYVDAATHVRAAVTAGNMLSLIPDGVHPDYAGTAAKKLYAAAVLRGPVGVAEFTPAVVPTGTIGFKVRVLHNGQADNIVSLKMLKILPYYKDTFAFSAVAGVSTTGLFGSYNAGYPGFTNKASDFPCEFLITTDQEPTGLIALSAGQLRGIRAYEIYRSETPEAFSDFAHPSWRLIDREYSTRAVAFDLFPNKRDKVFYRLQIDGSNGTDGTGGTTGQYVKVSKVWPGINPVRFALLNNIATLTGPYERADLVFSAAGGSSSAHFSNSQNTFPYHICWESPCAVPSVVIGDTGEAQRGIAAWKLFVSTDPSAINDASHASWVQIATGTGAGTITPSWPHV